MVMDYIPGRSILSFLSMMKAGADGCGAHIPVWLPDGDHAIYDVLKKWEKLSRAVAYQVFSSLSNNS